MSHYVSNRGVNMDRGRVSRHDQALYNKMKKPYRRSRPRPARNDASEVAAEAIANSEFQRPMVFKGFHRTNVQVSVPEREVEVIHVENVASTSNGRRNGSAFVIDRKGDQANSMKIKLPRTDLLTPVADRDEVTIFIRGFAGGTTSEQFQMKLREYGRVTEVLLSSSYAEYHRPNVARVRMLVNEGKIRNKNIFLISEELIEINGREIEISRPYLKSQEKHMFTAPTLNHNAIVKKLHKVLSFKDQVNVLLDNVLLTDNHKKNRRMLMDFLEDLLLYNGFDQCQMTALGSTNNGIGLRDSDIDIFVEVPRLNQSQAPVERYHALHLLGQVHKILKKEFKMFISKPIQARCPIVVVDFGQLARIQRLSDRDGLTCDLSISNILGTFNTKLVEFFSRKQPLFRDLALILKYWFKTKQLIGPNFLTSYGCLMLVIFYLQSLHVLPSVNALQIDPRGEQLSLNVCNQANVYFNENSDFFESSQCQRPELSTLLLGFFNFYAHFPYEHFAISPHFGVPLTKHEAYSGHGLKLLNIGISIMDILQLNSNIAQNMKKDFDIELRSLFKLVDDAIGSLQTEVEEEEYARLIMVRMFHPQQFTAKKNAQFIWDKELYEFRHRPELLIVAQRFNEIKENREKLAPLFVRATEEFLKDELGFPTIKLRENLDLASELRRVPIALFNVQPRDEHHGSWRMAADVNQCPLLGPIFLTFSLYMNFVPSAPIVEVVFDDSVAIHEVAKLKKYIVDRLGSIFEGVLFKLRSRDIVDD